MDTGTMGITNSLSHPAKFFIPYWLSMINNRFLWGENSDRLG
jgi:hypothetical protein